MTPIQEDWFGQIPSHWQSGNIRRFATMKTGHTPSRSVPEYWHNTSIPWFTLADIWQIRDGTRKHLAETESLISDLGLANSAAELLPEGTVVLSRTASVGFSGIMSRCMATSQDFWNWICGPQVLPQYLLYTFRAMQPHLRGFMMGSTHKTIYQADAASLRIPVPPMAEQKEIVAHLDRETARIDSLTAKQRRLIATLRERRSRLLCDATLGHADPVSSQTEPTDGFLPLGYGCTVTLGKMLDAGKAVREGDEQLPYLRAAHVQDEGLQIHGIKQMPFSAAEAADLDLRQGDVLVVEGGAGFGNSVVLDRDLVGWSFQKTLNRVRPFTGWSPRYLAYVIRTYRDAGVFEVLCNKSTIPHLTAEKLRALRIPIPPVDVQRAVAVKLDKQMAMIDDLIDRVERFIELAQERRSALITAAVTGQIDARGQVA